MTKHNRWRSVYMQSMCHVLKSNNFNIAEYYRCITITSHHHRIPSQASIYRRGCVRHHRIPYRLQNRPSLKQLRCAGRTTIASIKDVAPMRRCRYTLRRWRIRSKIPVHFQAPIAACPDRSHIMVIAVMIMIIARFGPFWQGCPPDLRCCKKA